MQEVRNAQGKRICDLSPDGKSIVISLKGCLTRITANPDGTFNFEDITPAQAA